MNAIVRGEFFYQGFEFGLGGIFAETMKAPSDPDRGAGIGFVANVNFARRIVADEHYRKIAFAVSLRIIKV